ncbi:hypothetical protein BDW66DRAFT_11281 [Aspergillus desertorum]
MSGPPRPVSRADFRVAILCPLPLEAEVVKPLFDGVYSVIDHPALSKVLGDPNSYTLGRIGSYDVVLVYMPSAGKAIASSVATHMKVSYPRIQLAFLIGVCGGVPFIDKSLATRGNTEIYLGDVIISTGIVQYDRLPFASLCKDTIESNLGRPNHEIRSFLSKIKTRSDALRDGQCQYLATIQDTVRAQCPGSQNDVLYSRKYDHRKENCQCSSDSKVDKTVIARRRKSDVVPFLHFGMLASGDSVMMSSKVRDSIAEQERVIGFEMEGAGVWDQFPCILVKGVSDYADSHKSKGWQYFAAASAAACMRAILDEEPIFIAPSAGPGQDQQLTLGASLRNRKEDPFHVEQAQEDLFIRMLGFARADFRRNEIAEAHKGTCTWITKQPEFRAWAEARDPDLQQSFFWIRGKPGVGKSTMVKYLLKDATKTRKNCVVLSFFFCAKGAELERSAVGMYRTLLHQLLILGAVSPDAQHRFFEIAAEVQRNQGDLDWSIRDLKGLLRAAIQSLGGRRVFLMIDALDECGQDEISDIISFLQHLVSSASASGVCLKVCLSTRHYPLSNISHGIEFVLEDQPEHHSDIRKYVEATLTGGGSRTAKEAKDEICDKASGVFLWVHCVVRSLNETFNVGKMRKVQQLLGETPDDLHRVFTDIFIRDEEGMDDLIFCLQLVLLSPRPLSREELYSAISFANCGLVRQDIDLQTDTVMDKYIINVSRGLVEIAQSKAQFIHGSLKDLLLRRNGFSILRAELGDNIVGRSHEKIFRVCLNYVCEVSRDKRYRDIVRELADLPRQMQAEFIREDAPFLGYACSNFLYHFREAEAAGIVETPFLNLMGVRAIEEDGLCLLDSAHGDGMEMMNLLLNSAPSEARSETEKRRKSSI